jgi:hypothetical protein
MWTVRAWALGVSLAVVLLQSRAHAQEQGEWQCTNHAECGGGLLCKSGACVEPPTKPRSVPLMVGGGALIGIGALLAFAGGYRTQANADETKSIVLMVTGAGLIAGGLPLVIIGKQRVPVAPTTATFTPYLGPKNAGVGFFLAF